MFNALTSILQRNGKARALLSMIAGVLVIASTSCSGGPNATPGVVVVTISPGSASLAAGATQQFTAIVTGTNNSAVTWEVNGVNGGSAAAGTIKSGGLYTAPTSITNSRVTVTAVSVEDASAAASATVTFATSASLTLAPSTATVPTNGAQLLTVTLSGSSSNSQQLAWSVGGVVGGNSSLGTISPNSATTAVYTAPPAIPLQNPVAIGVVSLAEPSVSASATITISCGAANSITPSSATVLLSATQKFSASLCVDQGGVIAWDVNGVNGGNNTFGTIVVNGASTATYTAPTAVPSPSVVTIHATTGSATASASITLASGVSVSVTPQSATIASSGSVTLTPTVTGASNGNVTWTVNGISNGNATVGQICDAAANPCVPPVGGFAGSVVYLAPASAPTQNPVSVVATSSADSTKSAASLITISSGSTTTNGTIAPLYAFVAATGGAPSTQQFFVEDPTGASVPVSWSVTSAVADAGCSGAACGTISASGLYTAPPQAPSPNAVSVVATTLSSPPQTFTATLAITSGVTIETVLPSSVSGGAVEGFPLELDGLNFVAGGGAPASVILVNGVARATTCPTANSCATPLNPSDVAGAGALTIQIQNPNGALSNAVQLVVVPLSTSNSTLQLSSAQASLNSIQLTVAEPTTAASGSPMNVNFIGPISDGNCTIGAAPIIVSRPASGTSSVSICVQGNDLDPTFTYSFGGPGGAPNGTDIPVTASGIVGLLPNMIQLNLEISSSTSPGLRTLFIATLNGDRAAATGMLEIQ